ncbi:MAG: LysM peptidoglycan-binding domain-containing protein [Anaerolineales bacterium]|nr:LysM peptidoglycan-binding domain-containing protein [Anaerolineales bacterium]
MKRFAYWMLIPLLSLIVGLFPSEQVIAQPGLFSPDPSAQELINEVNALRSSNGLLPYKTNSILMGVAQSHADYLALKGIVTHFGADGSRPYQRAIAAGYSVAGDLSTGGSFAENIHSGSNLTPAGVVTFWQGDTVNLAAMLSAEYQDVGVGEAIANGVTYYVLVVGSEGNALVPTATATLPLSVFVISTAGARATPEIVVFLSTPLENGEIFHVVKKSEALWSIALAYGTTVEQLKVLNGLASDEIFEGQTLLVFRPIPDTATPTIEVTATLGIPTSTATLPVTSTATSTPTPVPTAPVSRQSSGLVVGIIVLGALLAAGVGAWLGRKRSKTVVD